MPRMLVSLVLLVLVCAAANGCPYGNCSDGRCPVPSVAARPGPLVPSSPSSRFWLIVPPVDSSSTREAPKGDVTLPASEPRGGFSPILPPVYAPALKTCWLVTTTAHHETRRRGGWLPSQHELSWLLICASRG